MSDRPKYSIFDLPKIPCEEISNSDALVKEPIVSVKMITYNHEPYIAQAIEGVIQQETSFPFELVIGEDCSTDATREIVLEYQKKHPNIIRVVTSDNNVGATNNSYRVIKACRGKYITYCEGDDYWHHPQKLQMQVDFLESHPDVGLVHGDVDSFNVSTGRRIKRLNGYEGLRYSAVGDDLFVSILERKYHVRTLTVCVRRNLLIQVVDSDPLVFQHGRFLMCDTPCWLELSKITNFKYIDESLGTYNVLTESASHFQDGCKFYEFYQSILDTVRYYTAKYMPAYSIDRIISRYITMMLRHAYYNQDSELAKKTLKLASRLNCEQLLLYLGATNQVLHYGLAPFAGLARFAKDLKRRCKTGFSSH